MNDREGIGKEDPPDVSDDGTRVILEIARDRLSMQMSQIDGLDTKVTSIFGFGSAVAAITAAFLALQSEKLVAIVQLLLGIGLVSYLIMSFEALRTLKVRKWQSGPDLHDLRSRLNEPNQNVAQLQRLVASSLSDALKWNEQHLRPKAASTRRLMWMLASEAIFLIVGMALVAIF